MTDDCYKGWEDGGGDCCCNCQFHIEDFHHCTTVKERTDCVCSQHKGWICMSPETERAFSGWHEHGMCEMHQRKKNEFKTNDKKRTEEKRIIEKENWS